MDQFIWQDIFSVGIKLFDDQHKELFEIGNRLYLGVMDSKPTQLVEDILQELCDYAEVHFRDEEYYMRKFNYTKLEEQIKQHEEFKNKIQNLKQDFHDGKLFISIKLINFLIDWLNDHILYKDREYIALLKDKNIRST